MRITLLGSAVDGPWPDPWCGCGVCREAVSGRVRRDRAAVLAGRILLDLPTVPWHRELPRATDLVLTREVPGPSPRGVRVHRPRPGERLLLDDGPVLALPAAESDAVALLLPGPGLLYAPHGLAAVPDEPVALAVVGGPVPDLPGTADGTCLVPLARHGVPAAAGTVPDDGTVLCGRRTVLVTGGTRSGKSRHAERMLAATPDVTYLASGPVPGAHDVEWAARVRAHRERRPTSWRTVESTDVTAVLRAAETPVLWDCVGTWLTAQLDAAGAWERTDGWRERVDEQVAALLEAWRAARTTVVAVTNEVGSAVVPATASGRLFTDLLGRVNTALADDADELTLVVAGRAVPL